jgi:cytochrome c oxidase assembly protein subunit 15
MSRARAKSDDRSAFARGVGLGHIGAVLSRRYATYAWAFLGYNVAVVLFGAYVRASGSGAGCGSHWPLCNGDVLPRAAAEATIIEFTHRVTSGLALLGVIALAFFAYRLKLSRAVRRAAMCSLVFMLTEAAIGAGIVLFEYVAANTSIARGYWMAAHLLNTFSLLAALALTAWFASDRKVPDLSRHRGLATAFALVLLALLLAGVSGAIAALGDTLFPSRTLAEALAADTSPTAHAFVRLRVWHPVVAIVAASSVLIAGGYVYRTTRDRLVRRASAITVAIVLVQVAVGFVNVTLLAPIPLQLVHLALADAVWLGAVLVGTGALAAAPVREAAPAIELSDAAAPRS